MASSENPESKFANGETLEGKLSFWGKGKWELNQTELKISNRPSIPLNQITHVQRLNKVVKVWTDGVEPVFEFESTANMRGLATILKQQVAKRQENGDRLDCTAPSGRHLTTASIWPWSFFIIMGMLALITAIALTGMSLPKDGWGAVPMLAVLYLLAVAMFWAARLKGPRLECYDHEIHKVGYTGNRNVLRYDDINAMTSDVVKVISKDSANKPKIKTKLSFEGTHETIHFRDGAGVVRNELKATEEFIATLLVEKFWKKIENGESVPFGNKLNLSKEGICKPDGACVPYSEVAEIRMENGVALFFKDGDKKPFLKVKSKEKNFLPCYELLTVMCNSKMTYLEYCGKEVKPIFGD